jgi:isopenicillin N synthase-like dioxygenase
MGDTSAAAPATGLERGPAREPSHTGGFRQIPIVSLAADSGDDAERAAFAEELCRICHEVGFLLLVDHGIDTAFLDQHVAMLDAFFALDESVKAQIDKRRSRHFRGWERVGAELTDNRVDYREQLDVSTEHRAHAADIEPAYLRLDGPNQWLAEEQLPGFRSAVDAFFERMGAVAERLMAALARGLGLAEDHFRILFGERPTSFVKLIRYPQTPRGQAGVNAHHDAGFLTVLVQHGVGGLQALNPDGEWIDVPPIPGTLVINLGEMLQSMTGNYFVATTHRVIAHEPRLSSAYFHGPDLRTSLAPLALDPRFAAAVKASPRHAAAGFMAKRDELLNGQGGTSSTSAATYGQQLWNYYVRSYPGNVAAHYLDQLA